MLALDFLRVPFARAMHLGVQMPGVGAPMIGVVAGQPEGLEQRCELQKDFICAATKDVSQDLARAVIDGMPEPTWVAQFIRVCSWSQLVYICPSRPRGGSSTFTRLALKQGGDAQLFSQVLRAT